MLKFFRFWFEAYFLNFFTFFNRLCVFTKLKIMITIMINKIDLNLESRIIDNRLPISDVNSRDSREQPKKHHCIKFVISKLFSIINLDI